MLQTNHFLTGGIRCYFVLSPSHWLLPARFFPTKLRPKLRRQFLTGRTCPRLHSCRLHWFGGRIIRLQRKRSFARLLGHLVRRLQSRNSVVRGVPKQIPERWTQSDWRFDG